MLLTDASLYRLFTTSSSVEPSTNLHAATVSSPSNSRTDHNATNNIYPPYAHALAGAGAGLAAVALLHPLDTIRTHMQSSDTISAVSRTSARPQPVLRTLRYISTKHGALSLYRGLVPASFGSVISWACYFHFFQKGRTTISSYMPSHPTVAHLLSGTFAGVVTSVVTNPIWVVKVRLQLQPSPSSFRRTRFRPYEGFMDGLVTIVREEGVYGLYRGIAPSLWLVSHGALQFTLYEGMKARLRHSRSAATVSEADGRRSTQRNFISNDDSKGTSVPDALLASTASKLIASVSTYPLQVARTRMQERMASGEIYGSFHRTLWHIVRTEGMRGLYCGLFANILRVTPQAAITFVTYEQILHLCAKK